MLDFSLKTCEVLNSLSLAYSDSMVCNILKFEKIFFKWNAVHNLSSLKSKEDFYFDHLFDSLVLVKILSQSSNSIFYDLGSGNGFPGLLAAIFLEKKSFILVDSSEKKTIFLNYALRNLFLKNAKVLNSHFDKLDYSDDHFEVFSRALGLYDQQINFFSKTSISKLYFMSTEEIYKNLLLIDLDKTKFNKIETNNKYYKKLNKKNIKYKNKTIITVV